MCGINGFNFEDKNLIKKMNHLLKHRGPDSNGHYIDSKVSLGQTRLSIIDLSTAGSQPMSNENGDIWIVYNGEVYNFKELKECLNNHKFKSETDTEVLIHLYEEHGKEMLSKLNGMFAFCIYDSNKKQLLLARDRTGVKPLYYCFDGNKFIFSSEIKAILAHNIPKVINYNSLAFYLMYGYTLDESLIGGIKQLPPATYLIFDLEKKTITEGKFWQLVENIVEADIDEVEALLKDSVKRRLIADVPVGSYLSGGIDSSIITALSRPYIDEYHTFNVNFGDEVYSESKYARIVSDHLGTIHHELTVEIDKVIKEINNIAWHYDDPIAEGGTIPNYFVSKLAKKYVTVALAGEGGDEVFGGYKWYRYQPKLVKYSKYIPKIPEIGSSSKRKKIRMINKAKKGIEELQASTHLWLSPSEIKNISNFDYSDPKINYLGHANYELKKTINKMQYIDINTLLQSYNQKSDRMTMAFAVEERVPFQDYRLIEASFSLSDELKINKGNEKYIIKKIGEKYLPNEIVNREKRGYGVPISHWIETKLMGEIVRKFDSSNLLEDKIFIKDFYKKIKYHHNTYWSLYALELWYDNYMLN
ncbi:MAG: asparagine synthase (glutamine-hydrolyzing) [Candidatus Methanofastidiosum sp.]|nr:asparagine synthase (glutamine-hydrolyzing) [Methanofastidiosum sp.]